MEVQSDCNNVAALVLYAMIFDLCFMSGYNNSNFQMCSIVPTITNGAVKAENLRGMYGDLM